MNMLKEANLIYRMGINKKRKIYLLEQNAIDCSSEMDAQDQNMRPEICNNQSEGLRKTKDYLRKLKTLL
ncbi:hypothetical protein IB633_09125 [Francisella philomiragia]|uniref:Uncharacterized protein n=2 Tax=Francisella TaxID=262 RepID=B0U0V6_FRAP2|nr:MULTISPECIES: hypothetical protein [Francisella]AIT08545.1 hypothetical protein LO80_00205 [Francisella sp. FSC1006]AJI46707.1 hypothetical protein BF30_90 [Francisella philomiragia]AJI48522.1 hypothetical protein KU46_1461 [Francisella philomiragia]MBK2021332.1 hypothetical protein [Francisella philomiragia]MBK2031213.1 hypothetical protein [Francisella philomiragia]